MPTREQFLDKLRELQSKALTLNSLDPVDKFSHNDYREEIERAKPSDKPEYWAKKGCKDCCGTGVVGIVTTNIGNSSNKLRSSQICSCVRKRWHSWQDAFVENLKRARFPRKPEQFQRVMKDLPTKTSSNQPQQERLAKRIAALQESSRELSRQREELPQRAELEAAQNVVLLEQDAWKSKKSEADRIREAITVCESNAIEFRTLARKASGKASALMQQLNQEVAPAVAAAVDKVHSANQAADLVKKSLARSEHQIDKKIREIEKKLDKLQSRFARAQQESHSPRVSATQNCSPAE